MRISHSEIPRALIACYQVGMELNLRIRELREARGWTVAYLASLVGVSSPHMSQVERGIKNINNHLLVRCANALGVSPDELISSNDNQKYRQLIDDINDLSDDDLRRVATFVRNLRETS